MSFPFYVEKPIEFDQATGKADCAKEPLVRKLSNMKNMYADDAAYNAQLAEEDKLLYEFYDMGVPEKDGELAFGTSILYPGTVGNEFHMTNGHFHTILDTAEVYYCQNGYGMMLMENPEGDVIAKEMRPGQAVYVPARYAHRSINLSDTETLVTFFVFRADAGHDYGTIKEKGFRKLVVKTDSGYDIIDNPRWRG